ncbi:MAG: hypothetical protein IJN48_06235, partial [Clostridia bacterium]|nr:hypothetical protein [Clostridia bacterium]
TTVPETTEVVTTEITTPEITTTEATTTEPPLPDFSVYEGIWYATGYKIIFSNGDTGNCEFSCTGQFFELEEEFNVSELVNDTYSCIYYDPMMGIDILLEFKFEYPSIVMTSVEKYPDGSKSSPQIEVFEHK